MWNLKRAEQDEVQQHAESHLRNAIEDLKSIKPLLIQHRQGLKVPHPNPKFRSPLNLAEDKWFGVMTMLDYAREFGQRSTNHQQRVDFMRQLMEAQKLTHQIGRQISELKHASSRKWFQKLANEEVLRKLRELKQQIKDDEDEINECNVAVDTNSFQDTLDNLPSYEKTSSIKTASVTFSIMDSYKISQPKTLGDIGYELRDWAHKNVPKELQLPSWEAIAADGDYHFEYEGVLNWYVPPEVDMQEVSPYIMKAISEELSPMGIVVGSIRQDKSNSMNANVWRLDITQNDTKDIEKLPELNVANANAAKLLQSLGLTSSPHGEIQAAELIERIQAAKSQRLEDFERPAYDTVRVPAGGTGDSDEGGLRMIDPGLNQEKILWYYDALLQVAQRALQMNDPVVVWG